ncbi:TRAP transporter small permease [Tropicimonas sp.]|uniref:TRAP transporter small permease n=1 Tax=Tropicimonas sp. TaxID=2067044 RepID=UPI003A877174
MQGLIAWLARAMALLGGLVLSLLVLLTCISVSGRGLNTLGHSDLMRGVSAAAADALVASGVGPVPGDFELVEAGIAFAVFAFLPICQLRGGHATVDIFAARMPGCVNRFLAAFWEVAMALLIVLIAWRLWLGMEDKRGYGEITYLLQFPVWWAYAASFVAAFAASVVAAYCAATRIVVLATGREMCTEAEDPAR